MFAPTSLRTKSTRSKNVNNSTCAQVAADRGCGVPMRFLRESRAWSAIQLGVRQTPVRSA
jgi:hypothetical protein